MKKINIAVDGYSSTGKSTIAKQLAGELGYIYVDSGAMYRAVTLYAMQEGYINNNSFHKEQLIDNLNNINLKFIFNKQLGFAEIYLNGVNVDTEIRSLDVADLVSTVAAISEIRSYLVKQQLAFGVDKGVVMDGRDIGTVVFPDAALKLFITSSPETRARRRFDELKNRGDKVDYNSILQNVKNRDHLDSTRKDSPLIKAKDAIEIDTTNLSISEQFELALRYAKESIRKA